MPGLFDIKELDKLDSKGHVKDSRDYDVKTFNRLFYWSMFAAAGIAQLERDGTPVRDFTKEKLREAINSSLKEGGVI